MRLFARCCLIGLLIGLFAASAAVAESAERLLNYRIIGSTPGFDLFEQVAVQKLLLDIAKSPRTGAYIDSALQGCSVTRDDLSRFCIVRLDGGKYVVDFPLYTVSDQRMIRKVAERYAPSLAKAFLSRKDEIADILRSYSAPGVDSKAVAFILIGCVSLDWDGLDFTEEKGYRILRERPGGHYVPWAEEASGMTVERLYWGSTSWMQNGVFFATFGDHQVTDRPVPGSDTAPHAGSWMLALRDHARTLDELRSIAGISTDDTEKEARRLAEFGFITAYNDGYRANIPVFSLQDTTMIRQLREIDTNIMGDWLKQNYRKIRADLRSTVPARSGVPFEEEFSVIWHYVFGMANRQMVQEGLLADPYAENRKYKGFIPAIFDGGIF